MKEEQVERKDRLVEAAVRRFSHFGVTKTTLAEVADDLALTKQALTHYFPDKQSLVAASIQKVADEYCEELSKEMVAAPNVGAALQLLTRVKLQFFRKHFLLLSQGSQPDWVRSEWQQNWFRSLRERELSILENLFSKGVKTRELKPVNTSEIGGLLLDTLYAFARCVKEQGALPDEELFDRVLLKQRQVINIFYQAIRFGSTSN